jgi:NADPH-dependent 7-cyano-7-deazaguanine reductase QueF
MSTKITYELDKTMNADEALKYIAQEYGISTENQPYYIAKDIIKKLNNSEVALTALYSIWAKSDEVISGLKE